MSLFGTQSIMGPSPAKSTSSHVDDSGTEKESRAAVMHYVTLRCAIEELTSKMTDKIDQPALTAALQQIQQATNGFNRNLSFRLAPKYWNKVRSYNSTIAGRTVEVAELVERILLYADHGDIARMRQVNRNFRNVVKGSSKLQARLYLKDADSSRFSEGKYHNFFEDNYPVLSVRTAKDRNNVELFFDAMQSDWNGNVEVCFSRIGEKGRLLRIGSFWKRMLICQPPIKLMVVQKCCRLHGLLPDNKEAIRSETALTVGDLC
jgi:hypothetical protein